MLRKLGKIAGDIIIKYGLAIKRTSTDHYYSLDSILVRLGPLLVRAKSVYTIGEAGIFRFMDAEFSPQYRIRHVNIKTQSLAGLDEHIADNENFIIRISSPGNELAILGQLEKHLPRAEIIWISTSFYNMNENPAHFFRLLGFLKNHGYGYLGIVAGTQESYWQPVQDYAGLSIMACRCVD